MTGAGGPAAADFGGRFEASLRRGMESAPWARPHLPRWLPLIPRWRHLAALVLEWNERAGLTAIAGPEEMAHKHVLDSLSLLTLPWAADARTGVDVGSGGGFPGLVIALARPDLRLALVEASRKKAGFLQHAAAALGVEAAVYHARAEDLGRGEHRERYELGLARAAGPLAVSCEYVLPLVRVGGAYLAQAGPEDGAWLAALGALEPAGPPGAAWRVLGAALRQVARVDLPEGAGQRYLAVFQKVTPTPPGYPRRAGVPAKSPLPSR